MVGQFIHCDLHRLSLHPAHVIKHGLEKRLSIAVHIVVVFVAVFFHPGEEPGNGLHKSIIIHNGIPLIALEP